MLRQVNQQRQQGLSQAALINVLVSFTSGGEAADGCMEASLNSLRSLPGELMEGKTGKGGEREDGKAKYEQMEELIRKGKRWTWRRGGRENLTRAWRR